MCVCVWKIVVRMEAGYRGRYAVHEASRVDVLRLLVRHGADLNVHDDDGQTPLHIASRHSNIQVLHELICGGAADHLGRSAIHHAALGNAVCVYLMSSQFYFRCLKSTGLVLFQFYIIFSVLI